MTDGELIDFASEFRSGILGDDPSAMMCAAVSWPLAAFLRCHGVDCDTPTSIVQTDYGQCNHVWIRLSDGRVLDPTADQFGNYPPVYLGPPNDALHAITGGGQ